MKPVRDEGSGFAPHARRSGFCRFDAEVMSGDVVDVDAAEFGNAEANGEGDDDCGNGGAL